MIDLKSSDLIIADGAGRECWFTDHFPPKMPKTRRQQDKAMERKDRVGGKKCRSGRLKKKKKAARIRAAYLAGSILEGYVSWEMVNPRKCPMCADNPIDVEVIYG